MGGGLRYFLIFFFVEAIHALGFCCIFCTKESLINVTRAGLNVLKLAKKLFFKLYYMVFVKYN